MFNFPTALALMDRGHPVARAGWSGEFDVCPTRWLTRKHGVMINNTATGSNTLRSGDLTLDDINASDYVLPKGCEADIIALPDLPSVAISATTPQFDVYNPPCKVA